MADVTPDFLAAQLNRVLDGQRMVREDVADLRAVVRSLEQRTIGVERSLNLLREDLARIDVHRDRVRDQMGRIERRLDLADQAES
jgi:hypothetical protein